MSSEAHIDIESKSDVDLREVGLDIYSAHPSTEILMISYARGDDPVRLWDCTEGGPMPHDLFAIFEDESCLIWAFNAQFERVMIERIWGIKPDLRRWRCQMVKGFMHSFVGDLDAQGRQMEIEADQQKMAEGKRLIRKFTMPQRITKNQALRWHDSLSHPADWETFKDYCRQDVAAERAQKKKLAPYFVPAAEWELYAIDQEINDAGIPIDRQFVVNAIRMSDRRKAELLREMQDLTGLVNPGSVPQLLPWLKARGYWLNDLQKNTVKKVLNENSIEGQEFYNTLTEECVAALKLRQQAARTSVRKYNAILKALAPDNRLRFCLQFAGASRTNRWAGRRFQPQNLPGTPAVFEGNPWLLEYVTQAIRDGDYDALCLLMAEPLDALAGLVRSAIRAPKGYQFVVCDLSSIESCVIGWVSRCMRLIKVFEDGKDAYKDFATELYKIAYEEVTKLQRKNSKPATLGAGFRLGGGDLFEGKKTGLWGYAENMGIHLTRDESHESVAVFRRVYKEIPKLWYDLEDAIKTTIRTKRKTSVGFVSFFMQDQFLVAKLPSGRCIYYHKPRIRPMKMKFRDRKTGEMKTVTKDQISYMGKQQNGKAWVRIQSHGGKFTENLVQAIARDVLCVGMIRAYKAGFKLVMHVHDELVAMHRIGSNFFTLERLRELMKRKIKWAPGLPLGAAGFENPLYMKD